MNRLKFNLLCKSLSCAGINRNFHTHSLLLVRRREKFGASEDPGIRHMKKTFEDDENIDEQLCDENDIVEFDDFDFDDIEKGYDKLKRDRKWEKNLAARQIAKKKFFLPKQPIMLTCIEKKCMKYLHKTDPQQWTVQALSESFPATPGIVKKILKTNYKITPESEQKMDLKVQKNWKLLAENKLDGNPKYLEHCKQFVNKREMILDHIKEQNFDLPEDRTEKVYNCGEMNSILAEYENSINEMLYLDKFLSLNDKNAKNVKLTEKKSSLESLHEKVNEEKNILDLEGKDSFKLNLSTPNSKKQLTFDEIYKNVLKKAENKEELSITEKAILEVAFKKGENIQTDPVLKNTHFSREISSKNKFENFKTSINDSDFYQTSSTDVKVLPNKDNLFEEEPENTFMYESTFKAENLGRIFQFTENQVKFQIETEEEKPQKKKNKLKKDKSLPAPIDSLNENKTNNDNYINEDNHTFEIENYSLLKADDTGSNTEFSQSFDSIKELEEDNLKNKIMISCEESKNKEACEDVDLYNNNQEIEREAIKAPEIHSKVSDLSINKKSVEFEDYYPERIFIPKEKRNLGSLFKVRDCYYDYDGRFLYKVPGMTK